MLNTFDSKRLANGIKSAAKIGVFQTWGRSWNGERFFRIWSSDSFRKRAVWVWSGSGCSRKREFMVISRIEYEYSGPQKASAKPRPPSKLF
jgi:hypothetical protein